MECRRYVMRRNGDGGMEMDYVECQADPLPAAAYVLAADHEAALKAERERTAGWKAESLHAVENHAKEAEACGVLRGQLQQDLHWAISRAAVDNQAHEQCALAWGAERDYLKGKLTQAREELHGIAVIADRRPLPDLSGAATILKARLMLDADEIDALKKRVAELEADLERTRSHLLDADRDATRCVSCDDVLSLDLTVEAVDDEGEGCGRMCEPCAEEAASSDD